MDQVWYKACHCHVDVFFFTSSLRDRNVVILIFLFNSFCSVNIYTYKHNDTSHTAAEAGFLGEQKQEVRSQA